MAGGTKVWETGNIASSHRALNKMAVALKKKDAVAGVLVVPDQDLARWLTDRIGNVRELRPYMDELWGDFANRFGLLAIYVVTYDELDESVPLMPKGKDGQAQQYRDRLRRAKKESEQ